MPIYTLYLTTKITTANLPITPVFPQTISTSTLPNVTWQVDWDNLFRKEQGKYNFCKVRFDLVSESFTASTPASTDWTNYGGYLAVSLPSNFNAVTTNGTILGQIWPSDCPVTGTNIHCIINSTMSENGININMPTGTSLFNVQMIKGDGFVPMPLFQQYNILFSFELYN
jgi:hypothetical protein